VWSARGNLQDIPTDCTQRDERLGWMGDAALSVEQALYNFGASSAGTAVAIFAQWLDMVADEQDPRTGDIGDVVPRVWQLGAMQPADPNWGSAYPSVTHALWRATGDMNLVRRHLPNLMLYLHSLEASVNRTGLAHMIAKYGDWFAPSEASPASKPLVSASAFIHDVRAVGDMARAVGESAAADHCTALRSSLAAEFNRVWLQVGPNGTGTSYASGLQTELALPLWLGIVPAPARAAVVEALVDSIQQHGFHVSFEPQTHLPAGYRL